MTKLLIFFLLSVRNPDSISLETTNSAISRDTTIVGKLIDNDSIFLNRRSTYFGVKYYYGVHHLRIACINPANNSSNDTLIVAYVYNNTSEHSLYMKNFNLKIGATYIWNIADFKPCQSDFPRIQGKCDQQEFSFLPESNKLIKEYKHIYRVINFYPYQRSGKNTK